LLFLIVLLENYHHSRQKQNFLFNEIEGARMTISRIVAVETLDGLATDNPVAMRSRRDLRRIHLVMGTRAILLRALHDLTVSLRKDTPLRVLELGAGDGTLMLGVARALAPTWLTIPNKSLNPIGMRMKLPIWPTLYPCPSIYTKPVRELLDKVILTVVPFTS